MEILLLRYSQIYRKSKMEESFILLWPFISTFLIIGFFLVLMALGGCCTYHREPNRETDKITANVQVDMEKGNDLKSIITN